MLSTLHGVWSELRADKPTTLSPSAAQILHQLVPFAWQLFACQHEENRTLELGMVCGTLCQIHWVFSQILYWSVADRERLALHTQSSL